MEIKPNLLNGHRQNYRKMDSVSELAMAVDAKFNSILNEIQSSKLNFIINVAQYAAYITLEKSTHREKNGIAVQPSPLILRLLRESLRDKCNSEAEISQLKAALLKSEKCCEDLSQANQTLSDQLTTLKDLLLESENENEDIRNKLELKAIEENRVRDDM